MCIRDRNTTISEYTIVGRGVTIENYVKIGKRCKLESESYITAYSELEDYVFIAPSVVTSNDNYLGRTEERFKHFKGITVKKGGRIGANAVILPGKTIGEDALVAAGSVVTKDVPPGETVSGYPAKNHMMAMRMEGALRSLPDLMKKVRAQEKKIEELERIIKERS